ncbi:MAG: hypothetical protein AB4372_29465, partial [Xenococcus sp. (in: cyanobacteria)]
KSAHEARRIKKQNEININQFYINCFTQVQVDYKRHIAFLATYPSSEHITEYKLQNCIYDVEKDFFDQIVLNILQQAQQKEEATAAIKTVCTLAGLGLGVASIDELNEIGNSLSSISDALEDLV